MTKRNGDAVSKQPIFRQLDEKHLASETGIMRWSPKMDLIAVANVQGEVALHRLSWQKVWTLSPPGDALTVLSLAWRPDGKVLAIGYSSAMIVLCDTENKDVLHTHVPDGPPVLMQWSSERDTSDMDKHSFVFKDDSSTFLPSLPPLNKNFSLGLAGPSGDSATDHVNGEDSRTLFDQKWLTILLVITTSHTINLYAFGIFPCLEYSMKTIEVLGTGGTVDRLLSAVLSDDFAHLFVVVQVGCTKSESTLQMLTFELPLLASRLNELFALSTKYGQLASLLGYVASTIQSILESWEDILLEIDTKLIDYAREKRKRVADDETVADDFLDLLMFGMPSDELQKFLLHDLTEKGLKKLVHSIEHSYSNIQKLVLKQLQSVGQGIVYHLSNVLGMARWYDRFGVLGLRPDTVERSLAAAGAFVFKVTEVQQVIDQSMKNLKAFFRWLYVVILHLSQEHVSGEITKITQQELHFVAQFLKDSFSFQVGTDVGDGSTGQGHPSRSGFNLERVGQYLRDENLLLPPDMSDNVWANFVKSKANLKDEVMLYKYPTEKSLIQQHTILKESIKSAFDGVSEVTAHAMHPCRTYTLSWVKLGDESKLVRQQWIPSAGLLYTAFCVHLQPSDGFVLAIQSAGIGTVRSLRAVSVKFTELGEAQQEDKCSAHDVIDFQFYNEETMSVLLLERRSESRSCPVLVQLPLKPIVERAQDVSSLADGTTLASEITAVVNSGRDLHGSAFQQLPGVKALRLAVSGSRHVVCVLFESKRRIRLYEMDIEDDEEEDVSSILPDESFECQPGTSSNANGASGSALDSKMEDEDKENSF